jgi:hypothetical protein
VTEVHAAPTTTERDVQLHEARKAAKKARYAGETMTEFFGKAADRFAKAMETLQEELGEHQDSVVMRTRLEELARQETAPAAAFAYGRLHAQEEQRGQLAVDRFETVWRKATKQSLRSWINLTPDRRADTANGLLHTVRQLSGALPVAVVRRPVRRSRPHSRTFVGHRSSMLLRADDGGLRARRSRMPTSAARGRRPFESIRAPRS